MKVKNVLIVSARGFGNLGDDIVSMVAGAVFKTVRSSVKVRFADLVYQQSDMEWADIVVLGGGGTLYDSSKENVENYLRFIDHANLMGKPAVAIGMGTQGIKTEYGRRRYKESLSTLKLITVRSDHDAKILSDIGVRIPVHVITDLAFLLPDMIKAMKELYEYESPAYMERLQGLRQDLSPGSRVIGVSIARESADVHVDRMSFIPKKSYTRTHKETLHFIDKLVDDPMNQVVLFLQSKDDELMYDEIKAKYGDRVELIKSSGSMEALAILDAYSLFDAVVTSRYHGFIASILTEKPTYIVNGVNSAKILRTVSEFIPSLTNNIYPIDSMPVDLLSNLEVSQSQKDETNTTIVNSRRLLEYISSLMTRY